MKKLFLIIISVFFIVINVNAQWVFEKKIDEFTDDIAIYIYNETPIKTSNNIKEQFITIGFDKETIWVSLSFGEYIGTLYPDTNRGVQVRIRFDKDQYTVEKWRLSDSGYYLYTYYPPYEFLENIINHKELLIEATKSNNRAKPNKVRHFQSITPFFTPKTTFSANNTLYQPYPRCQNPVHSQDIFYTCFERRQSQRGQTKPETLSCLAEDISVN